MSYKNDTGGREMRNPGDPELAARVRAARAYAGLEQKALAQALGSMSVGTYKRIEQGARPVSKAERTKIAEVCGVPTSFMEEGWDALLVVSDDVLAHRMLDLLNRMDAKLQNVEKLVAEQVPDQRLAMAIVAARSALERVENSR